MEKNKNAFDRSWFWIALALIFITLKLTNQIDWSWGWVLAPLWIPWVLLLTMLVIFALFVLLIG